jgi:hypothetical protein
MNLHAESWQGVLLACVDGAIDLDSSRQMFEQIAITAAERQLSKVLIDGRLISGELSIEQREELSARAADYLVKLGTSPSIAIVGHPPTVNGLGAAAVRSRGFNLRVFPSILEAVEWLSEAPIPRQLKK